MSSRESTRPAGYDPDAYPRFAVTVDIAVFTIERQQLKVVLVERGGEPFQGAWALPGGFVQPREDLDAAAARELAEETGLDAPAPHLEQLGAYGHPDRDPRMRVVTIAYWAIVADLDTPRGGSDAAASFLVPVDTALSREERLAFDHHRILTDALHTVRASLRTTPLATKFLRNRFTISELRNVYEQLWDVELDPGNFHNRIIEWDLLEPTGEFRRGGRGRPAELYRAAETVDPATRSGSR
jgi:8-oxo-dGTP diphosphatase